VPYIGVEWSPIVVEVNVLPRTGLEAAFSGHNPGQDGLIPVRNQGE
jgi:hypothetical protein